MNGIETDDERATRVVRAVFAEDLKGDVGYLARRSVSLDDRNDIIVRLIREFGEVRAAERHARSLETA